MLSSQFKTQEDAVESVQNVNVSSHIKTQEDAVESVQNSTQKDAGPGKRDWQALTGYKVSQQAGLSEIDSQRPGYKAA